MIGYFVTYHRLILAFSLTTGAWIAATVAVSRSLRRFTQGRTDLSSSQSRDRTNVGFVLLTFINVISRFPLKFSYGNILPVEHQPGGEEQHPHKDLVLLADTTYLLTILACKALIFGLCWPTVPNEGFHTACRWLNAFGTVVGSFNTLLSKVGPNAILVDMISAVLPNPEEFIRELWKPRESFSFNPAIDALVQFTAFAMLYEAGCSPMQKKRLAFTLFVGLAGFLADVSTLRPPLAVLKHQPSAVSYAFVGSLAGQLFTALFAPISIFLIAISAPETEPSSQGLHGLNKHSDKMSFSSAAPEIDKTETELFSVPKQNVSSADRAKQASEESRSDGSTT